MAHKMAALLHLHGKGPATLHELAEATLISRSNIFAALQSLIRAGSVRREVDRYAATAAGHQLVETWETALRSESLDPR